MRPTWHCRCGEQAHTLRDFEAHRKGRAECGVRFVSRPAADLPVPFEPPRDERWWSNERKGNGAPSEGRYLEEHLASLKRLGLTREDLAMLSATKYDRRLPSGGEE